MGGRGSNIPKIVYTSFKYGPQADPSVGSHRPDLSSEQHRVKEGEEGATDSNNLETLQGAPTDEIDWVSDLLNHLFLADRVGKHELAI